VACAVVLCFCKLTVRACPSSFESSSSASLRGWSAPCRVAVVSHGTRCYISGAAANSNVYSSVERSGLDSNVSNYPSSRIEFDHRGAASADSLNSVIKAPRRPIRNGTQSVLTRSIRLHPPRKVRHVPDRIVDVGLAHRNRVHFAAMPQFTLSVMEQLSRRLSASVMMPLSACCRGVGTGKEE
jgi:hypothetical protein